MTHHLWGRHFLAALVVLLTLGAACRKRDPVDRDTVLERADAASLVGGWDVTLVLESPLTQLNHSGEAARPITGTIAFTENRTSDKEVAGFGAVTHKGVYDLDLGAFGLPVGDDARSQGAVARTVPLPRNRQSPQHHQGADSVFIALVPSDARLSVRLTGLLRGDGIGGSWIAEFVRTEARGRFVMTRQRVVR